MNARLREAAKEMIILSIRRNTSQISDQELDAIADRHALSDFERDQIPKEIALIIAGVNRVTNAARKRLGEGP